MKATLVINLESNLIIECYKHVLRQVLGKVDRTVSEGKCRKFVFRSQH